MVVVVVIVIVVIVTNLNIFNERETKTTTTTTSTLAKIKENYTRKSKIKIPKGNITEVITVERHVWLLGSYQFLMNNL